MPTSNTARVARATSASAAPATNAIETFRSYAAAFQSLNAGEVARHFHTPALLIAPHVVFSLSSTDEVEETYKRVLGDAAAKGYARTEFSPLLERHLAEDLAVISGNGAWKKASGEELQRFGISYTLRRVEGKWLIVVAAIHDPIPSPR
jgi:hypothetical protein